MNFKRIPNNKAIKVVDLNVSDTVLFNNKVCMVASRNGHPFLLDLETGTEAKRSTLDSEVVRIECDLTYKVL